jgi:Helix-turn-helix domain
MSGASNAGGLRARLAALEERVAALERAAERPATAVAVAADAETFWALRGLKQRLDPDTGAVLYTGTVPLPTGERYEWQLGTLTGELLELDWAQLSDTVGALGHPVRLHLLQRILCGARTVAELGDDETLGTTGQLYHHLRQLVAVGWLEPRGRGRYAVPSRRVVPLLVVLAAAQR